MVGETGGQGGHGEYGEKMQTPHREALPQVNTGPSSY